MQASILSLASPLLGSSGAGNEGCTYWWSSERLARRCGTVPGSVGTFWCGVLRMESSLYHLFLGGEWGCSAGDFFRTTSCVFSSSCSFSTRMNGP